MKFRSKITIMTNAQEWLDRNYPPNERQNITKLLICNASEFENGSFQRIVAVDYESKHYLTVSESLTGALDLSSFPQLQKLMIRNQFINKLILTDCRNLKEIFGMDNLLREIELPEQTEELNVISLVNNNFVRQDLSRFANFTNLWGLYLGTNNDNRIGNNVYNRWNGSLVHLRNLTKLEELDINSTDIDSGLEFLPTDELIRFTCGDIGRIGARVNQIKEICDFDEEDASDENIDENLFKVGEIRRLQEEWEDYQNQIEVQTNY